VRTKEHGIGQGRNPVWVRRLIVESPSDTIRQKQQILRRSLVAFDNPE
jgi:hypothetical protein